MQFSLKDLLAIVAFVAVISWCAGEIGRYDAAFWIVVITLAITSTAFVMAARLKTGRWLVLLTPGIALAPTCLMVFTPALSVTAFILFVGGAVACFFARPLPTKLLCAFAMVCMAASFVVAARDVQGEVRKLEALRQEFPIVSLANRLAYEQHDEPETASTEVSNARLSGEATKRLDAFEVDLDNNNRRQRDLEAIHDRQFERFVRSMGFGIMRMRRPHAGSIRKSPLHDIVFNHSMSDDSDYGGDWDANLWFDDSNSLEHLHKVGRIDFLDPNGFGAVIEPKQAAGFIEHAMHFPPKAALKDRDAWTIERLELVSLLKFDEPRVYVLDHLPRMDQLSGDDVPTRPLDEFEKDSLEKLRSAEDLIVAEQGGVHRMLGSLRAAKQCLDCHSVERGELLGAFSYVLRRGEKGEVETTAPSTN